MVVLVVFNCFYIYDLLQRVNRVSPHPDLVSGSTAIEEGFTIFGNSTSELQHITNTTVIGSKIAKMDATAKLPIREYCVKASYNSACSGTYIGVDVLKYVLSRGCRYLDLEVYLVDNVPYVGFSTNPSDTTQNITSATTITLNDALTTINVFGFSSPAPNATDPLFINLRPQSCGTDPNTSGMYKYIAGDITNTLMPKLINDKITGDTSIQTVMNKIVIVMDVVAAPEYAKEPLLKKLVNMESGGNVFRTETYKRMEKYPLSPPVVDKKGKSNVAFFREVHPDSGDNTNPVANPRYYKFVGDHGVQFVANRFYINDAALREYEDFFDNFETAFVSFSRGISFVKERNE
jgi:hypothetical protein